MALIGVALAIPEPYGSFLQAQRERFGDPLAHAIPAHVTLLPPTAIGDEDLAGFEGHLNAVASESAPFDVLLESTSSFRPISPVVFVALARGGEECALLQKRVRSGPVVRDLEFDYHPHITVAHHVGEEQLDSAQTELADFSAAFRVTDFHLYHHGLDNVWRPVRAFELGG